MHGPPLIVAFGVAQTFGILAVVFVILAATGENDSVLNKLRNDATQRFVWHPVLMSIGMVYLFGCSAVIYRVLSFMEKLHAKIIHGFIHMCVVILSLAGLVLAVQMVNSYNGSHFTSLHGLCGLITIVLFCTQWVLSIPVFLWPKAPDGIRATALPVHVLVGIGVFVSACVTAMTGFNSKPGSLPTDDTYPAYYKTSAFFYLFYTLTILYVVTVRKYKRENM